MKQLAINVVKNTAIENIVCTPNTVVLANQHQRENGRGIDDRAIYRSVPD